MSVKFAKFINITFKYLLCFLSLKEKFRISLHIYQRFQRLLLKNQQQQKQTFWKQTKFK